MTTIGADPEAFLFNEKEGTFASSEGLLGGSKDRPLEVPGGAILEDNVTAEFNTMPVDLDDGPEAFIESIVVVKNHLAEVVAEKGYSLKFASAAPIPAKYLGTAQTMESGCDPDYNIYSSMQNEYPWIGATDIRYAGGHVHIGNDNIVSNPDWVHNVVASMDCSLSALLIYLEGISERTSVYGKLGNFRPKPYGLEYRSSSSLWVEDENLMKFVHFCVKQAIEDAQHGQNHAERAKLISEYIKANDVDSVQQFILPSVHNYASELGIL